MKNHPLPELQTLERLIVQGAPFLRHRRIAGIRHQGSEFPIYSLAMGSEDRKKPALVFVGGIHGLERIGTQVILAFLETLIQRLQWDDAFRDQLKSIRLLFLPLMNPVGMVLNTRSNGRGVDLMRNAPVEAEGKVPFLLGGHRLSRNLPWFRGGRLDPMEIEADALCQEIRRELFDSPLSLALDCHSGFGFDDQIWFPYASSPKPIEHLPEIFALKQLLVTTYPNHEYVFEPQARNYMAHGDLWDYLYQEAADRGANFIPLTMELGSWRWVKKNPRQLVELLGFFHPMLPHRLKRVLRRHVVLMDFLMNAVRSHGAWLPTPDQRPQIQREALQHWYG